MGYKPIPTKKFEKWLKKRGLICKRRTASHDVWNYPDGQEQLWRPVIFRGAQKEIPGFHIHTNLITLNVDYDTFLKEI
jgi:hypothetical protein